MADNTLDQFLDDQEAYDDGPAKGARAPILLTHFDGAMDAGTAGHLAIEQLLHTLDTQRVATFESDMFIDYRSHRPVMNIDDWVTTSLEVPEIALDLVYDDAGVPLLVLHGPEPDAKWETFVRAVSHLAEQAGVEISFSLHGIPSGVPHTRPTPVHMHATDGSLLPEQPQMS
ncbi:MAG: PAC2 family protein, partial [Actinomyces sp.]|nr:PAC2 family protein [Actinomyces sp.]